MSPLPRLIVVATTFLPALALLLWTGSSSAAEFRPKPETYLCPNASKLGVDCFLDAVDHLYTMCRQVKSIELIEFGLEHAEEGVNGAKSEYCVDKHKASMARPFQAALREASGSRIALDALRALHDLWLQSLTELKWKPPETSDEYQQRVGHVYELFHERASFVRTALSEAKTAKPPTTARTRVKSAAAQHRPN
ncbi:MAG TPA: hypothetical protein VFC24_14055 [Casimicrobiaceae bacterium]|nr:hypothetical protein [Casimicrobiaceae bacterium]